MHGNKHHFASRPLTLRNQFHDIRLHAMNSCVRRELRNDSLDCGLINPPRDVDTRVRKSFSGLVDMRQSILADLNSVMLANIRAYLME